jgi:hypothetical protein
MYVVQNSQNFSGLFPSSGIPKNMMFRKLDLFPSSGEGGGEDTYSVGPLWECWSQFISSPPPSSEDGNRSSFRNVVFFGLPYDGKSPEKFCEFCTVICMLQYNLQIFCREWQPKILLRFHSLELLKLFYTDFMIILALEMYKCGQSTRCGRIH